MFRNTILLSLAASAKLAAAGLYPGITPHNHTCALVDPILSCSAGADASKVDSCCTETFGGLVLITQFWDTYTGLEKDGQLLPQKAWTIHGGWPDFCSGKYTQYCDLSRQYDPKPSPNTTTGTSDGTPVPPYKGESIDKWFVPNGKADLLAYMNRHWVSQLDPNWVLWAHEYSKHATCFSTFQTECYGPNYSKFDDLFEFFETVIRYHRTLPTYDWLSAAGIKPSNRTSYSVAKIQKVLSDSYGQPPFIGCGGPKYNETEAGKGSLDNGGTVLNEMWWYMNVLGRIQDHQALRLPATVGGRLTSCAQADNAVWYYERTNGSEFR
ncbi:unnamed protein product [Clonostachys solani]|uniref:ribonuclease T2 n=1 Tax=Clonostachys solani TaxID=160281 RepID=A0A9N9Z5W9_9HYPO|nr:unnamed protein product [Clonostachys solani]